MQRKLLTETSDGIKVRKVKYLEDALFCLYPGRPSDLSPAHGDIIYSSSKNQIISAGSMNRTIHCYMSIDTKCSWFQRIQWQANLKTVQSKDVASVSFQAMKHRPPRACLAFDPQNKRMFQGVVRCDPLLRSQVEAFVQQINK